MQEGAILQEGALKAAFDTLEADATIGALGGRIVLTDGGLQEAGNSLFRNGLAVGIGRRRGTGPLLDSHGKDVAPRCGAEPCSRRRS